MYISCGNSNRGITQRVTVEAWVKTSSSAYQWVAAKYLNSSFEEKGFHLYVTNGTAAISGRVGVGVYMSSGNSTTRVDDGRWHHLAGVCNVSTWQIYVDGILENAGVYNFQNTDLTTTTDFAIGAYTVQSGQYFNGEIDEVRLWRTVRTPAEIQANMCRKLGTAPADLVAYYRFDQASGNVATDQGSQPVPGALVGFPANPWHLSGAALGDVSAATYAATGSLATGSRLALATSTGDSAIVSTVAGQVRGLQLYAVNAPPSTAPPRPAAATYVGVFTAGPSFPASTYTLRLRPGTGTACRNAFVRPDNSALWTTPPQVVANATSLIVPAGSYRSETILVDDAPPVVVLGDSLVCAGAVTTLTLQAADIASIRWNNGVTTNTLANVPAGTYSATINFLGGCTQSATRVVRTRACLTLPNIITPNGDTYNEQFVIPGLRGEGWELTVFNRWGRSVYQTDNYHNDWGSDAAPGIYYILLRRAADGYQYKGWLEVVQ